MTFWRDLNLSKATYNNFPRHCGRNSQIRHHTSTWLGCTPHICTESDQADTSSPYRPLNGQMERRGSCVIQPVKGKKSHPCHSHKGIIVLISDGIKLTCAVFLVGLVTAIAGAVASPAGQDALSILTLVHRGVTRPPCNNRRRLLSNFFGVQQGLEPVPLPFELLFPL